MRLHAFLIDNVVIKVESIDPNQHSDASIGYNLVVDIEDYSVTPLVGWVLDGNKIVPSPEQMTTMKELIEARLRVYRSRVPELLVDLYATNTLSGMTDSQSDAGFSLHQDVIFCLNEGALPTAIYRLNKKVEAGTITREVADQWIAKIQAIML